MNATLILDKYIKNYENNNKFNIYSNQNSTNLSFNKYKYDNANKRFNLTNNNVNKINSGRLNHNKLYNNIEEDQQKLKLLNNIFTQKPTPNKTTSFSRYVSTTKNNKPCNQLDIIHDNKFMIKKNSSKKLDDTTTYIYTTFKAIDQVESLMTKLKTQADKYKMEEINNSKMKYQLDSQYSTSSSSSSLINKLDKINMNTYSTKLDNRKRTISNFNSIINNHVRFDDLNQKISNDITLNNLNQITNNKECVENFLKECLKIIDR
jgi:hypothetical protein